MRPVIEDMCKLLLEQKSLLEEMLALSYEKRRIIIGGKTELLEDIVRQEVKKLSQVKAAEKKRMALIPDIASLLGINGQEITISAIAERSEPDERLELEALHRDMSGLLQKQSMINDENQELIKAHVEYSNAIIELMSESEDPLNNYYGGDGKAADNKRAKSFYSGKA